LVYFVNRFLKYFVDNLNHTGARTQTRQNRRFDARNARKGTTDRRTHKRPAKRLKRALQGHSRRATDTARASAGTGARLATAGTIPPPQALERWNNTTPATETRTQHDQNRTERGNNPRNRWHEQTNARPQTIYNLYLYIGVQHN